ncbi:hypothetical protein PIROE2DRAFT_6306 [Piromyces sp. E2]|nr:hypothetical protein PIROE2DRAFT_6306 [Piromyces sp. E2]|eukprot:OUM66468.1 hypothetical protein PIROE2DRAFT_6306 [Piromyces sp. E2]
MDHRYLLCLSHYPFNVRFCFSLRVGTKLILHNVHLFSMREFVKNINLCFIACMYSSIELKSFSENHFPGILEKSIIIRKNISQYNSIDIIYKIYIMEWLKTYIFPEEYKDLNALLNSSSQKILYHSGYTAYHHQNLINEILYHDDFCNVALKRYSLPNFICIKTILTNTFVNNFLCNKLNSLISDYQSYEFTQEEIGIPNTWIVGLLEGSSTGQFRIFDNNNFMYLHIEDVIHNNNCNLLSLCHIANPILIKKFKVCLNFLNNNQQVQTYDSSTFYSQTSPKNKSVKNIFRENSDLSLSKRLILIKFFNHDDNNHLDECDYKILNHFKIYISVSLDDIYFLNDKEDLKSPLYALNSNKFISYLKYHHNFSYKIPNIITNFLNNIKIPNKESILRDNDYISILKILYKSPVHLEKSNIKLNPVSNLFGMIITLQKCFSIPNFSQDNPKYLPFYKVTKIYNKTIKLTSPDVLKIYPFISNHKYYRIQGNVSNIENERIIQLNKPLLEEVDIYLYKSKYNSSEFNRSIFASRASLHKIENIFPMSIHNPIIIYEPLLPKEYHHLLINNNSDEEIIQYISIRDLLCKDNNINSLYNLHCSKYLSVLKEIDEYFLNLTPFHIHTGNYLSLMNVSDVLKNNAKSSNELNNNNNNLVSFVGIIVGIHINYDDESSTNDTTNLFEVKLFLKNIGIGNHSAILILDVRDFYTPDIIQVFLNLKTIEYPFGLYVGNIIRFDKVCLTYLIKNREPSVYYVNNKRNTKITCYSNNNNNNVNELIKLIPLSSDQKTYRQPVLSSNKISKVLLKNLKRNFLVNLYDTSISHSHYSKFICDIREISEIYFAHKCRFCNCITYNGKCPNQDQHYFSSNIKFDCGNRKRKFESINESFQGNNNMSVYDFPKKCEHCDHGIIIARVKCIIEDGTAIANLVVTNVDAIYNLLQIKNKISYISYYEFEKYICQKGIICLYKDNKTNEFKDGEYSLNNINKYKIETANEKEMFSKIRNLLTMPSLLRQIVVYGRRIGYYNNEYFKSFKREKKDDNSNKKKVKYSNNLMDKIFEKYEVQILKIDNSNFNTVKKIAKKVNVDIYSIFIEEMNYSELIFEMIKNIAVI